MKRRIHVIMGLLFSFVTCACASTPEDAASSSFAIAVDATSDPGVPLEGVELRAGERVLGTTDAKGHALLDLHGFEGGIVEVGVRGPAAYECPAEPMAMTLRRFVGRGAQPTYTLSCPPTVRSVVAVIRAENGPNLPVLRLGREVARTGPSGIAHVLLEVKAGEPVELTLATLAKESERLRPQNPSLTFVAKGKDDYVVLEQKFVEEKPKGPAAAPRIKRPSRI